MESIHGSSPHERRAKSAGSDKQSSLMKLGEELTEVIARLIRAD